MDKRIVYTRHDGGVSVCCPADEAIAWLGCGGFWNHHPRGFADIQIERMVARGVREDAAVRYAVAMTKGGCTTAEALEIIRDRDCAHLGTAIELWDFDDVPRDRWFRNAWKRSQNGGPISIDMTLAKPIQFQRARTSVEQENKKRADSLRDVIEVDWRAFRQRILAAREDRELRQIWPTEFSCSATM